MARERWLMNECSVTERRALHKRFDFTTCVSLSILRVAGFVTQHCTLFMFPLSFQNLFTFLCRLFSLAVLILGDFHIPFLCSSHSLCGVIHFASCTLCCVASEYSYFQSAAAPSAAAATRTRATSLPIATALIPPPHALLRGVGALSPPPSAAATAAAAAHSSSSMPPTHYSPPSSVAALIAGVGSSPPTSTKAAVAAAEVSALRALAARASSPAPMPSAPTSRTMSVPIAPTSTEAVSVCASANVHHHHHQHRAFQSSHQSSNPSVYVQQGVCEQNAHSAAAAAYQHYHMQQLQNARQASQMSLQHRHDHQVQTNAALMQRLQQHLQQLRQQRSLNSAQSTRDAPEFYRPGHTSAALSSRTRNSPFHHHQPTPPSTDASDLRRSVSASPAAMSRAASASPLVMPTPPPRPKSA